MELGPGQPVSTIDQLKARFGVSQSTLSKALDRMRKEGIIHRPAGRKRLYTSDVSTRGVRRILIVRSTFPSPDYDAIVRELLRAGQILNWSFEVNAYQGSSEAMDIAQLGCDYDGIILACSPEMFTERFVAGLRRPPCPLVLIRELPADPEVSGVSVDNIEVGYRAVKHLAKLGHRRIVCLVCEQMSRTIRDRVQGWREAMSRIDAAGVPRLLVECPVPSGLDSMMLTWAHFGRWMRSSHRPDFSALFTVDWTGAVAAMRVLREDHGLSIPEDVSIISLAGEFPLAPFLNPPLTTVGYNLHALAEQALRMLEEQWEQQGNDQGSQQIWFKPVVEERGSTRSIGSSTWPEA